MYSETAKAAVNMLQQHHLLCLKLCHLFGLQPPCPPAPLGMQFHLLSCAGLSRHFHFKGLNQAWLFSFLTQFLRKTVQAFKIING